MDTALPNDIDQSELDYDSLEAARDDHYETPLLYDDRSPGEQLYYNEDFYDAPAESDCCEQDTWIQMSAQEAFAAFTVANVDEAGDMDMDCGVCENMGQGKRGTEHVQVGSVTSANMDIISNSVDIMQLWTEYGAAMWSTQDQLQKGHA